MHVINLTTLVKVSSAIDVDCVAKFQKNPTVHVPQWQKDYNFFCKSKRITPSTEKRLPNVQWKWRDFNAKRKENWIKNLSQWMLWKFTFLHQKLLHAQMNEHVEYDSHLAINWVIVCAPGPKAGWAVLEQLTRQLPCSPQKSSFMEQYWRIKLGSCHHVSM